MSGLPAIACPSCEETERLRGSRRGDGAVTITCEACGATWERDSQRRCGLCGSTDLRYTPKPLWERGRGDQRTPAGEIPSYACWACGGRDVTSPNPLPGTPPEA